MPRKLRHSLIPIFAALCAGAPAAAQAGVLADAGDVAGLVHPVSAGVADLDLDGHPDIVVADTAGVRVLRGKGGMAFALAPAALWSQGMPWATATGDLDGEGHPDAVVLDVDGLLHPFLSRAGGAQAVAPTALGAGTWTTVALGDVNGDGHLDAVAGDEEGGRLAVALGDGAGGFAAPILTTPLDAIHALALGHLGGDGALDVAAVEPGDEDAGLPGTLEILLGDGHGGFTPSGSHALADAADGVAAGASAPYVVAGDGAAEVFGVGSSGLPSPLSSLAAAASGPVALGDLDGDGVEELIAPVISGAGAGLAIRRGLPGHAFAAADGAPLPVGADPGTPVAADLDGDGPPDVIVPEYGSGAVRVLRNTLAPAPALSATSLAFPAPVLTQRVTLRNDGTYPLGVQGVEIVGPDAGHFQLVGVLLCVHRQAAAQLAPGQSCSASVGSDRTPGPHPEWRATLRFGTSAGPQEVALTAPAVAAGPPPVVVHLCLVPHLAGLTLPAATAVLARNHCALGRVTRPRAPRKTRHGKAKRRTLVVATQSQRPRTRAADGAKIAVTLKVKPAPKRRHKAHRRH